MVCVATSYYLRSLWIRIVGLMQSKVFEVTGYLAILLSLFENGSVFETWLVVVDPSYQ